MYSCNHCNAENIADLNVISEIIYDTDIPFGFIVYKYHEHCWKKYVGSALSGYLWTTSSPAHCQRCKQGILSEDYNRNFVRIQRMSTYGNQRVYLDFHKTCYYIIAPIPNIKKGPLDIFFSAAEKNK